mgnify:CR=1 FL=1
MSLDISYSGGVFSAPQAKSVGTVTSTSVDANFANVSLLLHGDGTSGSTTITDSSSNSVSMTVSGNTQIDTAVKKFGTGSIQFDGVGDQLSFTNTGFGTGDFTYEAWVYPDVQVQNFPAFFVVVDDASSSNRVTAQYDIDGQANKFRLNVGGTDIYSTSKSTGQWYHVAVVRSGTTVTFYLDGTSIGTATYSYDVPSHTGYIGGNTGRSSALSFKGYIDDLRITNGVARYTSNFTPPTAAFPNAAAFIDLDLSTGNYFNHTLSANTLVSFSNPPASGTAAGFALALTGGNAAETYDLANASYDSVSFSVATQDDNPRSVAFSSDGSKMFMLGTTGDSVYQYSLSTAWSPSSATYDSVSFSVGTQETSSGSIIFKSDGTSFYVIGYTNSVFQYDLTAAYDLSTASYASKSLSTGLTNAVGLSISTDGTKLWASDIGGTIQQFTMSTAWDVSTASSDSKSLDVSARGATTTAIYVSPDGSAVYITNLGTDTIYEYDLSTNYDISTGTYNSVSFSVATQETNPWGFTFKDDGSKMYLIGNIGDSVYQYTTGSTATATFTYPSSVKFPSGTAPAGPAIGETDVLVFYTDDGGTTYQASRAGNAMS